jgi:hypothetical protein
MVKNLVVRSMAKATKELEFLVQQVAGKEGVVPPFLPACYALKVSVTSTGWYLVTMVDNKFYNRGGMYNIKSGVILRIFISYAACYR